MAKLKFDNRIFGIVQIGGRQIPSVFYQAFPMLTNLGAELTTDQHNSLFELDTTLDEKRKVFEGLHKRRMKEFEVEGEIPKKMSDEDLKKSQEYMEEILDMEFTIDFTPIEYDHEKLGLTVSVRKTLTAIGVFASKGKTAKEVKK